MKRRVVVTGIGAINAIGHNVEETWKSIKDGVCGIGEITNYDNSLTKVKIAGEVKDFNVADYLDKKCAEIESTILKKQMLVEWLGKYKKSLIYEVVTGKKEV